MITYTIISALISTIITGIFITQMKMAGKLYPPMHQLIVWSCILVLWPLMIVIRTAHWLLND